MPDTSTAHIQAYHKGVLSTDLAALVGVSTGHTIVILGHTSAGDGGQGMARWDASDTSTTDDGGTVWGASNQGRWKRIYTGPVYMGWYGTVTAAKINTVITALSAAGGGALVVPEGAHTITGVGSDRIMPRANVRIVFEPGCTISTGAQSASSIVIHVDTNNTSGTAITDVRIEGNGLVITGSRSSTTTQYAIAVGASFSASTIRDVYISDIECRDCWTDGIVVGGNVGTTTDRVTFERVVCTNNRRQGASITGSATEIRFTDCVFETSNGASPQCGFDIELNNQTNPNYDVVRGVYLTRCVFRNNSGAGYLGQDPAYGSTCRVYLTDCVAYGNTLSGFVSATPESVLTGCRSYSNGQYGFSTSAEVQLVGCVSESNTLSGYQLGATTTRCKATDCIARWNKAEGFLVTTTAFANGPIDLVGCQALANYTKGFNLSGATSVTINGGSSVGNREDGVRFASSQHCTVTGAYIAGNGYATDNAADNVIIESTSNFNSVVGNTTRQSGAYLRTVAVVDAATTVTTIKLAVGSADDDEYNGMCVRITAGTESGAVGWVTDYVGSTKVITVSWDVALGGAPDGTSVVQINGTRLLHSSVFSATTTTLVLPDSASPSVSDLFVGAYVHVIAGTGAGQYGLISAYNGSTRTLTFSAMATAPQPADGLTASQTQIVIVSRNRPRYGIRVGAGCTSNRVELNDAYYAGVTGAYSDAGTSTYATAANRTT